MANPAAFIYYPSFKDLEKSHIKLVESMPHQKKIRKSRGEKKEQLADKNSLPKENCIVKYNFACNRENSATNIARIKKKDVEVLPTLDENEEKEEKNDSKTVDEIGTISESQTSFEKFRAEADPTTKAKSKFSNHSLVAHEVFVMPLISPRPGESDIQPQIPNKNIKREILEETSNNKRNTSSLNEATSISGIHLSQKETDNWRLQVVKCDQNIATLMPNTSEFQELNSNESLQVLGCTSRSTNGHEPKTRTGGFRKFKIFLGFVWALSFAGVVICIAVNNIAHKPKPTEIVAFKPTIREICLLIARNVRRLIVSPIHYTNPNVI